MTWKRIVLLLVGVAFVISLSWMLGSERREREVLRTSPGSLPVASSEEVSPSRSELVPEPSRATEDLPESLRGTEVDGELRMDAEGNFVPSPGALRMFNYFLSALGEEPLERIVERITDQVRASLPPAAAEQALSLLDDYLGYREALAGLARNGDVPADLERRLQWIRELRRGHFGADVAEALFAEDEAVARVAIEQRAVLQNPDLGPERREAELEALEERLPPDVREARRRASLPARVNKEIAELRAQGGSDDEVFALRERHFGAEAAERLAELDARRAAWQRRVDDYRAARDAIAADPALDAADRERAIAELRAKRFEGPERLRVEALERMERAD